MGGGAPGEGGGGINLLQDLLPGPYSTLLTTKALTCPGRDRSFNEGAAGPLANGNQRICRAASLLTVNSLCARGAHLLILIYWQRVGQLKFCKAMLLQCFR